MSEEDNKNDSRTNRVQPISLSTSFFPLNIHKSMFINDLMISIPKYYAESWGKSVIDKHNKDNSCWEVGMTYISPKDLKEKKHKFTVKLTLSASKDRSKESNYRIKWGKDFAEQLAKDYPKSFVRSLEFHIGDDYYKNRGFTEYDIGGFKEQLQMKIAWENDNPIIQVKELFKVREESQLFPNVFKELSSYLISDYLLSSEEELLRRVYVGTWKPRKEIIKELNENNIYILANKDKKEIYFGETKKSLSQRYPEKVPHHCFNEWTHFCVINLPPGTTSSMRLLIERTLIATGARLFKNSLYTNDIPVLEDLGIILKNRKK